MKWWEWIVVSWCGLLVVAAITAIVPGWTVVATWLSGSNAPAWVQAVGSVVAIAASWAAVQYQLQEARKRHSAEATEAEWTLTQACYLATFDAWQTLNYIAEQFREHEGQRFRLHTERIEDLQESFRLLVRNQLPPYLLTEVLRVQRELAYTLMALRQALRADEVSNTRVRNAARRAGIVKAVVLRLEAKHFAGADLTRAQLRPDPQDLSEMLAE